MPPERQTVLSINFVSPFFKLQSFQFCILFKRFGIRRENWPDDHVCKIMVIPVMEFQVRGYKIRKIPKRKLLNFENWYDREVSKSDKI